MLITSSAVTWLGHAPHAVYGVQYIDPVPLLTHRHLLRCPTGTLVEHGEEETRERFETGSPTKKDETCDDISEVQTRMCDNGYFKEWEANKGYKYAECTERCNTPNESANLNLTWLGHAPYVVYGVKYIDPVSLMAHQTRLPKPAKHTF